MPCISMVLEGVMDGQQGENLKCIVPLTNLNMVCITDYSLVFEVHRLLAILIPNDNQNSGG